MCTCGTIVQYVHTVCTVCTRLPTCMSQQGLICDSPFTPVERVGEVSLKIFSETNFFFKTEGQREGQTDRGPEAPATP